MNKLINTALEHLNINTLNKLQEKSLATSPDHDIIMLSPTGSGKTLAFLLPLLQVLDPESDYVQAIIVAPSRELAQQIEQVFRDLSSGMKICCCYGGHRLAIERRSLEYPTQVIVGTPGRLEDHIMKGTFDPSKIKTIILDEFDKSLEFGFENEMSAIIDHVPASAQKVLTSATFATEIPEFIQLKNLERLDFQVKDKEDEGKLTIKKVHTTSDHKLDVLLKLVCMTGRESVIIFCNYRESVDEVSDFLYDNGIFNETLHGGMEQRDRDRSLTKFKGGSVNVLVSTDLASRGLDIPEIKTIIHYHLPQSEDAFIHRNGRTARMHESGISYVLIETDKAVPDYIDENSEDVTLPQNCPPVPLPEWKTLFIYKGKKNKINKIDVAGFLYKKGGLVKGEVGIIDVKDYVTYVSISRLKAEEVFNKVKDQKLKSWKAKMTLLR